MTRNKTRIILFCKLTYTKLLSLLWTKLSFHTWENWDAKCLTMFTSVLKLKLQYFGHLMRRTDSFEETLMLGRLKEGGEGDDRGWNGWMASLTHWVWVWVNSSNFWCIHHCSTWSCKELDMTDWLSWTNWTNWTDLTKWQTGLQAKVLFTYLSCWLCCKNILLILSCAHLYRKC